MSVAETAVEPGVRLSAVHRALRMAAVGTGAVTALGVLTAGVLVGQARRARRAIPTAEAPPPRCDGVYGPRLPGTPLRLAVLGDSSAAGYGVHRPRETPGALLAMAISRRLRRPVLLRRHAVVGATSDRLAPQVEAALEMRPDLVVILIGANDVTHRASVSASVGDLLTAVRQLRAAGAEVVVGTCPDLGTIRPIQPPLRWIARRWSRQMAAAQTVAVVEAGAWTVSLGDLLGPKFAAEPHRMFAPDRFHPSAEGYAAAAAALLPTALRALGAAEERRAPLATTEGVQALSEAAHEAAKHPGTEVHGVQVAGRERGPAGRWALLRRRRMRLVQRRAEAAEIATAPMSIEPGDSAVPLGQATPDGEPPGVEQQ